MDKHHIFVSVSGGVAYVCDDTVPAGVAVEILDFDNLRELPQDANKLSPEARAYIARRGWDKDI
jgi:spore coat polysaccharide biosynthesis protein SpsF (cytidylyltransferase family)